jgi:DNA polymerase-1
VNGSGCMLSWRRGCKHLPALSFSPALLKITASMALAAPPPSAGTPATLYLIDGHAQIFRAYYAPFGALTAPTGEPTKATYTFTQMLLAILREKKPDYIAVALDFADETAERRQIFPEYKSHRDAMPEDLPRQVERIIDILERLEIPIFRIQGQEADDIIASIAERLPPGIELRVVSRDKDLHQLIGERVKLYDPVKDQLIDASTLEKELGYTPAQAVEIQTLTGDSTDNIPGIPGVGPKKALALIQKYGSAAAVCEHAAELTPKLRESVLAFRDSLDLTRRLVTLRKDVPLDLDLEACRARPIRRERLLPVFEELGFKRLVEYLASHAAPAEVLPASTRAALTRTADGRYHLINTPERFTEFLAALKREKCFAVDTETTSLRAVDCDLVGISFSWKAGEGWFLPLRSRNGITLDVESTIRELKPILEDPAIEKCGQNLKYDRITLRCAGIELQGTVFDSMVASYLLFPSRRTHGMDSLARDILGHETTPITALIGKGREQISMLDADMERLAEYAAEDADIAWRLYEELAPRMAASPQASLFRDVEMPLVEVLAEMEWHGVKIDCDYLRSLGFRMEGRLEELRRKIYATAGREFSIDSPKQLAAVLFDEQGLDSIKRTKTSRSTDAGVLEVLAAQTAHPLPRLILEYRELAKLKGTYLDPLPSLVSPRTGRLHASFHQTVAATGRLSSSDPNLQNIPIRTEQGREIRRAFVPSDRDHVLISADYSQIELRILAHLSSDPGLIEAFRTDQDIHTAVAAQVFGVAPAAVTREQRSRAKAVNFGIIYGQGAFGLARSLGIPQGEAAEFIRRYKQRYSGIVRFIDECVARAEETGAASTMLGRQRPIPEIRSRNRALRAQAERLAVNTVVQGSAADMIKLAMIRIHRHIRAERLDLRLLIQVHDELVLEGRRSEAPGDAEMVREEMAGALPLDVPVRVDVAWGDNWLEGKE